MTEQAEWQVDRDDLADAVEEGVGRGDQFYTDAIGG
jgi:hypothetical protein